MSTNRNRRASDLRVLERTARLAALRDGNNGPKSWRQKNARAVESRKACRKGNW